MNETRSPRHRFLLIIIGVLAASVSVLAVVHGHAGGRMASMRVSAKEDPFAFWCYVAVFGILALFAFYRAFAKRKDSPGP